MALHSSSRLRASGTVLLGAAVVVLPFLRGAVEPLAAAGVGLAACAAFAFSMRRGEGAPVPPLALAALLTLAWIALQLIPQPPWSLRLLSPAGASLLDHSLGPLGLFPAWRPSSLDPGATSLGLVLAVTCTFGLAASAGLARSPRRRHFLLRALASAGALASLALLFGAAAGTTTLLEPRWLFLNPNHMAAFLEMAALISLGLATSTSGPARLVWALAFVVMGAEILLSLSRGGIAAFCVGLVLFAALRRAPREAGPPQAGRRALGALLALVAVVMALGAVLALDALTAQLRTAETAGRELKWTLWPRALYMIAQFPLLGIGKGAFATVYPQYQLEPVPLTFTHVENVPLQLAVELGIPVALVLLVAFLWTWWTSARRPELSTNDAAALAALFAVAAHNLVDFSLELPGVALPFCVLAGMLARERIAWAIPRPVAWLLAASGASAALTGAALAAAHPPMDRVALEDRQPDEWLVAARSSVRWHPADYIPPTVAGGALVAAERCPEAMPWLERAMLLGPLRPDAHRLAGRCLALAGDRRALMQYRLAFTLGDGAALREAMAFYPELDDLLLIAPDIPDGLVSLGLLLLEDRPGEARVPLERAWREFEDPRALSALAHASLRLARYPDALDEARRLQLGAHDAEGGFWVAARALEALGEEGAARRELERGAARFPGSHRMLAELVRLALKDQRYTDARRLAERMSSETLAQLARKKTTLAGVFRAQGRIVEALSQAEGASAAQPDSLGAALLVADLAEQLEEHDRSLAALVHARALPGADAATLDKRIATARERRASATPPPDLERP